VIYCVIIIFNSQKKIITDCNCFRHRHSCGQGGQPSTTTEGANHGASSISGISMNAQDGLRRPKLQKYPPCMFGVQQRSFCKSWLGQFALLEYNATKVLLAV